MAEIWNLVDENGVATGIKHERGSGKPIPKGLYHIAVCVWVKPTFDTLLLTQRHPDKPEGLKWEVTYGSILDGESSFDGARRELFEETGIRVSDMEMYYLGSENEGSCRYECFLVEYGYMNEMPKLSLQAEEVVGYKLVKMNDLPELSDTLTRKTLDHYNMFRKALNGEVERYDYENMYAVSVTDIGANAEAVREFLSEAECAESGVPYPYAVYCKKKLASLGASSEVTECKADKL